ncbi:MAG TPA: ribosome maturation factor RimM [Steroidobacteraceae bacterium]
MNRYFVLGRILAPHGIRGALKVRSYTDPPQSLLQHRHWRVRRPDGNEQSYQVAGTHWDGHAMRVELEGVVDRDAAAALQDCDILIERAQRQAPAPGEYFRDDLVGFTVRNVEGALLGTVQHFLDAPAGALMVVRDAQQAERWLPASAPRLRRVDVERREIELDWPAEL